MSQSTQDPAAAKSDRERQRRERGVASRAQRASRDRMPAPPRRRRPALALLAVLVIVGCALLAGLLALRMDDRDPMLAVSANIPVGHQFTDKDFQQTSVASDVESLVPAEALDQVIGQYAAVNIGAGQLLDVNMLTDEVPLKSGESIVGVVLNPGSTPSTGVAVGDKVMVVHITPSSEEGGFPGVPVTEALVLDVGRASQGDLGEVSQSATGSVLVPTQAADEVAHISGNDEMALVLLERGVSRKGAALTPLDGAKSD